MTRYAIAISRFARATLVAGAALAYAAPSPALAQVNAPEPDAMDVARTPLEDFNIDSDDLPEVLVLAAEAPYADGGLDNCNDIVAQIALLDRALGADFDIATDQERGISEGRIAQSVIGSFIPFRGIVREVTGANDRRRQFNMAVTAGMVRRGYLKGMGQQRGCDYPARPRADRVSNSAEQ